MAYLIITLIVFRIVQLAVTNTRKYDHITPILQKLHWLPVRQHIHFKILLVTYKSINDIAFSVAAATLWNRLPADIRNASPLENFKFVLKTHRFKVAFTDK